MKHSIAIALTLWVSVVDLPSFTPGVPNISVSISKTDIGCAVELEKDMAKLGAFLIVDCTAYPDNAVISINADGTTSYTLIEEIQ